MKTYENQPNLAEIIKTSADVPSIFPDPWQNNVTSHNCHNRQPTTYKEVKTRRSSTLFIRSKVAQKKNIKGLNRYIKRLNLQNPGRHPANGSSRGLSRVTTTYELNHELMNITKII